MDNDGFQIIVLLVGIGIVIGMVIAGLAFISRDSRYTKFCPVCGHAYTNSDTYCADDGTLLKEKLD